MDRRTLLQSLAAAGALGGEALAAAPSGGPYNRTPQDGLMLWAKLIADLSGKTTYNLTTGTVWGFKPQADDLTVAEFAKRIYGYQSLTVRKARVTPEGHVAIKQQGWTFYLDPKTYLPVKELANPYNGQKVAANPMGGAAASEQVFTAAGPKSMQDAGYPAPSGQADRPYDLRVRVLGEHAFVDDGSFVRINPGGISWFKLEATFFSYACRAADLASSKLTHIPSTWSQNLVAEWQTWMNMHGEPGHILFRGVGAQVPIKQLPSEFTAAMAAQFPGQLEATASWDA